MKELAIFAGAGGGLLGTRLLGWDPIGYVENNDYCQRVLAARIRDGFLPEAPIFGDVRAFIRDGYAERYRGVVDVVTAGFPCQPFSNAGKQAGAEDERNLWPETAQCLRVVRPRFALLENVPSLLAHGYLGQILGDLATCGFNARWDCLPASSVGAPHQRDRLWIVATRCGVSDTEFVELRKFGERNREQRQEPSPAVARDYGAQEHLADADGERLEKRKDKRRSVAQQSAAQRGVPSNSWWTLEPELGRVVDGVANRVDRLGALGNGQVPAVVRAAWSRLIRRVI